MHPPPRRGYEVQRVHAHEARKRYACPACGNPIAAGEGHVVAWPEGSPDDRRHWHHHCWRHEAGRHATP